MGYRLALAIILSVSLIFIDIRFSHLQSVRYVLSSALTPIYWVSDIPHALKSGMNSLFTRREAIDDEMDLMRARLLVLERKSQKLSFVTAELNRLRELLNASRVLDEGVLVAELVGASADPENHYVVINKGARDKVYLGQAILDSDGLMGQVVEVSEFTSRVLLITDASHAVPVQVHRNGIRAIVYGVGSLSYMVLGNVPDTADIKEGDLLVSSGLGGRFPQGYPVARVSSVKHESGKAFAHVRVVPEAKLNRSRLLLLVFKAEQDIFDLESDPSESVKDSTPKERGGER